MISLQEVKRNFPAPTYRKYQPEVIVKIVDAFNSGVKVVLMDAPTGFGKSYIDIAFARSFDKSFYVTPQLTLIDQIKGDRYIQGKVCEIKGRENYMCVHDVLLLSVNLGMCRRVKDFPCKKWVECPYYSQKAKAMRSQVALMSFAYFILEGQLPEEVEYRFGNRDFCVLDESHSIDRYVVDHVSLEIAPWTIMPKIYSKFDKDLIEYSRLDSVKRLVFDIQVDIKNTVSSLQSTLDGGVALSDTEVKEKERLEDWLRKAERFMQSTEVAEWIWQLNWVTLGGKKYKVLRCQPVYASKFAPEMIWNRAKRFIVSSATILSPEMFVKENGIEYIFKIDEVLHLKVPSTFPPENRIILDLSPGKMRKNMIDTNLPFAVKQLEQIIEAEKGKNIAVHCHSYDIAKKVYEILAPEYRAMAIIHTSEDREEALAKWKHERGKVFLCVAFTEGQDWIGDVCGAQVLMKVPYPDLSDRRVSRRLERKQWNWFYLEALKQTIQAYGRQIRSQEDKKVFYVLDGSFKFLVNHCRRWVPKWFAEVLR